MPRKSQMSVSKAFDAAVRAGMKAGDTAEYDRWLERSGLADRGWLFRRKLRGEFERGVERGIDQRLAASRRAREKQEARRRRSEERRAAQRQRAELAKQRAEKRRAAERERSARKVEGYRIWQKEPGVWVSSLDGDSEFESYGDAARFTRAHAEGRSNPLRIPNPACGGTMPVKLITDRAKRYRANHPDCRPGGPKLCAFCGSKRNVEVHHLDGNEDNGSPANLAWACRSCNTRIGADHKRAGIGKRTRQFNKALTERVPSYAQYARAVSVHVKGAHDEGGAVIHATPPELRSQYARQIAAEKRKRGTHRRSEVPF